MSRCALALLLPLVVCAVMRGQDKLVEFRRGPYEVYTDSSKAAREALVHFEQFRNALGQITGDPDLQASMPIRILVLKKTNASYPPGVIEGRDAFYIVLDTTSKVPDITHAELARRFLEWNTARMPAGLENAVISLMTTIDIQGIHATLGRAPAPAKRDRDWALVDMLATNVETFGKLRVIVYNLRRGVDPEPAFRNALGKSPSDLYAQADAFLKAGSFPTLPVSPKPISERDFPERSIDSAAARLIFADMLVGGDSKATYATLVREGKNVAEAHEGLGLIALKEKNAAVARQEFEAAIAAKTKSPRAYIEYARLESDQAKAMASLQSAMQMNPKLAEPHAVFAQRSSDPEKRIVEFRKATELEPRNLGYWKSYAQAALDNKNFGEAAKAWRGAEQAAVAPEDRRQMHEARLAIEQQRLDYEAAERQRAADEERRDIERLKNEERAKLRALEARVNQGNSGNTDKAVPWWEGPAPKGAAQGVLKQVDCLPTRQARIVIEQDDRKLIKLLILDPGQIVVNGGGELNFTCGPQKPRRVKVGYNPKSNAKTATAGEVATIEFQ